MARQGARPLAATFCCAGGGSRQRAAQDMAGLAQADADHAERIEAAVPLLCEGAGAADAGAAGVPAGYVQAACLWALRDYLAFACAPHPAPHPAPSPVPKG